MCSGVEEQRVRAGFWACGFLLARVRSDATPAKPATLLGALAAAHHSSPSLPFAVTTMPATNDGWPEAFGFRIGGNGPCYILAVEAGSSAQVAGLQPGDQILEIEGQHVSSMSREALAALARQCENVPPSIGVVSRTQQVELEPGQEGRFGFTLMSDEGGLLQVEGVAPASPASKAGIKAGDYVLEVNGTPVKLYEEAAAVIQACQGGLRLGLLRLGRLQKWASSSVREFVQSADAIHQERRQKAQEFSKKVSPRALRERHAEGLEGKAQDRPTLEPTGLVVRGRLPPCPLCASSAAPPTLDRKRGTVVEEVWRRGVGCRAGASRHHPQAGSGVLGKPSLS